MYKGAQAGGPTGPRHPLPLHTIQYDTRYWYLMLSTVAMHDNRHLRRYLTHLLGSTLRRPR